MDEKAKLMVYKEDDEKQSLLLTLKKESMGEKSIWYHNNGSNNHMTKERSKFVELDTSKKNFLSFSDNTKVEIKGRGTILLEMKNGSQKVLCDVYYIPKLTSNNLSIGQLLERFYKIHIEDHML